MTTVATTAMSHTMAALGVATLLTGFTLPSAQAAGQASPPAISSLQKDNFCAAGDTLILKGGNFGVQGDRGYVTVHVPYRDFNGKTTFREYPVSVLKWTDREINTRLYRPAGGDTGTWLVNVHRQDRQVAARIFNVQGCAPLVRKDDKDIASEVLVEGFQKSQFCAQDDSIIIHGGNFGSQPNGGKVTIIGLRRDGNGEVFYHEYQAPITGWTNTQVHARLVNLPGAIPGVCVATVHRGDGQSASRDFSMLDCAQPAPPAPTPGTSTSVSEPGPTLEGFNRSTFCAAGDFMVIHGQNFGFEPSGAQVTIRAPFKGAGGTVSYQEYGASVVGWTPSQIQVRFAAPAGAAMGVYTVTVSLKRKEKGVDTIKSASQTFNVTNCPATAGQ